MENIWYKSYDPGVPHTVNPDQYASLIQLLEESSMRYADKPSVINYGEKITFKQLDHMSQAFAGYLQYHCKLQKGDRIAIMLPNILQYPIAIFGALRVGLIIVNVNPWIQHQEIVRVLLDTGTKNLLFSELYAKEIEKVLEEVHIENLFFTRTGDLFPFFKKMAVNFSLKYVERIVPKWHIPRAVSFVKTLNYRYIKRYEKIKIESKDLAFLLYTEGRSKSIEKCVMLSHRNMIANMLQCSCWMESFFHYKNAEALVNPFPFSKAVAMMGMLVMMRVGFATVLITDPLNVSALVKELKHISYSVFYGVNSLFKALLQNDEFCRLDFSKLKFTGGGAMPVQAAVAEKWLAVTGCPILQGFGLVETSAIAMMPPLSQRTYSESVGLPLPSTDIKICDNDGIELSLGETGELYIKGPQVTPGYWNKPEMTKNIIDEEGWLRTGDIVKIDEKGFIYLIDRLEDMIFRKGEKIYATHVEKMIGLIPGVQEVGVVGIVNKDKECLIKAYIVRTDNDLTKEKIMAFCEENLKNEEKPNIIEFTSILPHSMAGFLLRRVLREDAVRQLDLSEAHG